MNRNTKIILGIIGGLVVLCICIVGVFVVGGGLLARQVAQGVSEDPAQVDAKAAEIAEFDLPPGFSPAFSMGIMGMDFVGFEGNDTVIMLMQYPTSLQMNPEQLQEQMQQAMRNQGFNSGEMTVVDQVETTIKGQPATLVISESTTTGQKMRQATTMFEGNNGMTLLMIMGNADTWDQDAIDAFIQSIR